MSKIPYTKSLKEEYVRLYKNMEIKAKKLSIVENHGKQILKYKDRYLEVGEPIGVPWFFVGLIHTLESNRNFKSHLHNGDSLRNRTIRIPKGRPKKGKPPFTWEESAQDALQYQRLHLEKDWSLPRILYQLEAYNGWGYRLYHQHVKSPYLWSYSNHYKSGKYIRDGTFSDTAVSRQSGAAVIMRRMEQNRIIPAFGEEDLEISFFTYTLDVHPRADDLQRFLNTFPGISLLVDGRPYKRTSEACFKILGDYLPGDERRI